MRESFKSRCYLTVCGLILLATLSFCQTFEVNQGGKPPSSGKEKKSTGTTGNASPEGHNLGWGSSIEVARQARAAQDALKRGDYGAATTYAQQAANAAPQNTDLWFLLGYASRLAGRYTISIDAFQRGLKNQPNSIQGLSGLAQTYAKMGRDEEARRLLLSVLDSNPNDANVLQMAGELLLNSDTKRALSVLRRAEQLQPSPRTKLLIARTYQRLGQPEEAKQFLAAARNQAPHDPEILRAVAGQYRDAGQYDMAISTLESIPSRSPEVQIELAYTYGLAGQKQKAAGLYAQLAKAGRGNLDLQLSAAQALVNLGETNEALAFLDQAKKLNGAHYRVHALLAQIAVSEDRLPAAVSEYQLALQSLPQPPPEGPLYPAQLRLSLYELDVRMGDQTAASAELDRAAAALGDGNVPESQRLEYLRMKAAIESAYGHLESANEYLKQALALAPTNLDAMLSYGSLAWKLGRKDDARAMFQKVLELDSRNRAALTSLGFLARDDGDEKAAEAYFIRAVEAYPKDAALNLALGDLWASERKFRAAQTSYDAAYRAMPTNALIVAGGANAALEAHNLDLAKEWLDRAKGRMNEDPRVMRERQRYLTWKGEYEEAAKLGFGVIAQLPRDRQAPVYLAYDLYYLGRYEDALNLATKYEPILPNNKDLALIAGYVHARAHEFQEALHDFSRALQRDPNMATGYANRGYVLTDLREANKALKDFQSAIALQPDYGEAHLGLAYAYLQLRRPKPALEQLDLAAKLLSRTRPWHLARAEAFRQEQKFASAEKEYRVALESEPSDLTTQLALADTQYRLRHYAASIETLNAAAKLSPDTAAIYALLAQSEARLGQRDQALRHIQEAEKAGPGQSEVLMATGNTLLFLGDRDAAMQRFSRALDTPEGNRAGTRLAIAEIFVRENHWDDARRQIGLAFADARVGDAPPITADDLIESANILLALHDFDLAKAHFEKARLAGADERVVGLGLANTYLAEGKTKTADQELAKLGSPTEYQDDYDYMMARANLFRQRQDTVHALSAITRANILATSSNDDVTNAQYELAGEEGRQFNEKVSLFSTASFAPALEDINVYTMDARLAGVTDPALLPTPRHSFQSIGEEHYRLHLQDVPTISGFVGQSLTVGRLSFPSNDFIQDRHTYDTLFNAGISPVLHMGANTLAFNTGLQFTIRRDTISPVDLNQNLFRQFLYLSTSSFFNWVSIQASAIRETGPFTEQDLHSRDASARLEFTVGRPWGRTSLLAGYYARDLLFRPLIREYFTTSTYVGIQHKFGDKITAAILGEYLRSWRVKDTSFVAAQAMRPAVRFSYRPSIRWNVEGTFALSRGQGFHDYDNAEGEFLVSFVQPVRRSLKDGEGSVDVAYPFRFSFGIQQQSFYNFPGQSRTTILPIVRLTLF